MSVFMGLNLMFWNCQGIRSKRKELELYLKENNFDIVALNETFLTKKIDFKIQGYDTIKNYRSTGVRGGVAFLVKHGLVVNKEYRNTDFNIITDNEDGDVPELKSTQDIDKYADFITTAISTAVDKAIPQSKCGRLESQPISDETLALIKEKRKLRRQYFRLMTLW